MCLAVFIFYSANGYLLLIKMIKEGQPNVKDFLKNQELLHILENRRKFCMSSLREE